METRVKWAQPGLRYRVLTSGKTLRKGDRFIIDKNGDLQCSVGGWLNVNDWKKLNNKIKVDIDYYRSKIKVLTAEIQHCKRVLKGVENA